MSNGGEISIFGIDDPAGQRGWLKKRASELVYVRDTVPIEQLKERVESFLTSMREVLSEAPQTVGQYHVSEIVVSAEISAKGTVSIMGTGGELGGKGGLTFKFTRLD